MTNCMGKPVISIVSFRRDPDNIYFSKNLLEKLKPITIS